MSEIVIGYRQLEINQLETPKPSVARFEWTMQDASAAVVARGQVLVFGEKTLITGWQPAMEYWYVSAPGAGGQPVRTTLECKELVAAEAAYQMLSTFSAKDGFLAPMVPQPVGLKAGDPVLGQPALQGHFRVTSADGSTTTEAALWLVLEGARLRRVDWYWTGNKPLSLFPGGVKVGDKVELKEVTNGAPGFPQIGWNRCLQPTGPVAVMAGPL